MLTTQTMTSVAKKETSQTQNSPTNYMLTIDIVASSSCEGLRSPKHYHPRPLGQSYLVQLWLLDSPKICHPTNDVHHNVIDLTGNNFWLLGIQEQQESQLGLSTFNSHSWFLKNCHSTLKASRVSKMFCKCEHGAMLNNVSDSYEWWVSWSLAKTTSLKCMKMKHNMGHKCEAMSLQVATCSFKKLMSFLI